MARTILNKTIQTAQRVMEDRRDQSGLAQSMEIHDLKEQLYLCEKRCRELEREVNDYRKREQDLLTEIEELEERLRFSPTPLPSRAVSITQEALFKNAPATQPAEVPEGWEPFMYAYTDEVFVDYDAPDLLLYWNGSRYTNPRGTVILTPPITQQALDQYSILKVRPLTDEELDEISERYNLE